MAGCSGNGHERDQVARAACSLHPLNVMQFTKRLRERVKSGRIRCSVRIWTRPHVKAGGRYPLDDGHIVVDSIVPIDESDITYDLARESGFDSLEDLLATAHHGKGDHVYLIRFHYLPAGAWTPRRRAERRRSRGSQGGSASEGE